MAIQVVESWNEFVGVDRVVQHFKNALRIRRFEKSKDVNLSTFLFGDPGTGKSALAKKFGQCFLCPNLDPVTLEACNKCRACTELCKEGNDSIATRIEGSDYYWSPLDCASMAKMAPDAMINEITELQDAPGLFRTVHLEEVGCLGKRSDDLACLVPMDDKDFIWLATGMTLGGLSEAFLRRFSHKIRMTVPEPSELALWLAAKCKALGIACEDYQVVLKLSQRAKRRVGRAMQVLDVARSMKEPLTMELVDNHVFGFDD